MKIFYHNDLDGVASAATATFKRQYRNNTI